VRRGVDQSFSSFGTLDSAGGGTCTLAVLPAVCSGCSPACCHRLERVEDPRIWLHSANPSSGESPCTRRDFEMDSTSVLFHPQPDDDHHDRRTTVPAIATPTRMLPPPPRARPTATQPSPPCFLIPTTTPLSTDEVFLQGRVRHFITQKEFERWGKDHPTVRLRPEEGYRSVDESIRARIRATVFSCGCIQFSACGGSGTVGYCRGMLPSCRARRAVTRGLAGAVCLKDARRTRRRDKGRSTFLSPSQRASLECKLHPITVQLRRELQRPQWTREDDWRVLVF
jgi:hypothetical protein